jgi:hypothetical protein
MVRYLGLEASARSHLGLVVALGTYTHVCGVPVDCLYLKPTLVGEPFGCACFEANKKKRDETAIGRFLRREELRFTCW